VKYFKKLAVASDCVWGVDSGLVLKVEARDCGGGGSEISKVS
jgi:hypothetical protein